MPADLAIIIVNWRDYAKKYLADLLLSLKVQNYQGGFKVFIVDNETDLESRDLIQSTIKTVWPDLNYELLINEKNDGFAKGNNDAIKLALAQNFDYVALFNIDTVLAKDCLRQLLSVARSDKAIGAVQARLMLWPEKNTINSLGNITHFLGFGYCQGYNTKITDDKLKITNIIYPSGAAVLFKAEVLKKIDLFDEEFWMYNEDQDLGWRLSLAGWHSVLAPEAVVYHKYNFSKNQKKYYWLDRNRLLVIFKNYRLATLILIVPALLVMELGLLFFSLTNHWFWQKLKVYAYFLRPSTWHYLVQARRQAQGLRTVSDRQITRLFSGQILYQEINSPGLALANVFFNIYWAIAKWLILW